MSFRWLRAPHPTRSPGRAGHPVPAGAVDSAEHRGWPVRDGRESGRATEGPVRHGGVLHHHHPAGQRVRVHQHQQQARRPVPRSHHTPHHTDRQSGKLSSHLCIPEGTKHDFLIPTHVRSDLPL